MYGMTPRLTPAHHVETFLDAARRSGLDLDALAERLGVTHSTVLRWLSGVGIPQAQHWETLDAFIAAQEALAAEKKGH